MNGQMDETTAVTMPKAMPTNCKCRYCERDGGHASDCGVHGTPFVRDGGCTCLQRAGDLRGGAR